MIMLYFLMKVKITQLCSTLCDPMDYTVHGILQAKILEQVAFPFSRGSFQPQYPDLLADSLPAEPQEESRYIGMGSVFLLQQIFLTQISNWGLLHCRQILYQLSYQGSLQKMCKQLLQINKKSTQTHILQQKNEKNTQTVKLLRDQQICEDQ